MPDPTTNTDSLQQVGGFLGLNAYSETDASKFFGRDVEIQQLQRLIKLNVLTIVFGKSGTGKSSLLRAGIYPILRANRCCPFTIRLEFLDHSPPLMTQILQVLRNDIQALGYKIAPIEEDITLWEFFHRESLWKIITPVLVFDQFEEIFTLASTHSNKKLELDNLITELSDLIENTIPERRKAKYLKDSRALDFNYKYQEAKIILSFREDFLPEMEAITYRIPSVKHSRFRLLPLNGNQALEVITKTWGDLIHPAEAKRIVYYLTNEVESVSTDDENEYEKFNRIEIEPALLSQTCLYLDKQRIKAKLNTVTKELLDKFPKGLILKTIYHLALKEIDRSNDEAEHIDKKVTGSQIQEFIEENLLTAEGFRTKCAIVEIPPAIAPGVEVMKHKFFLREDGGSIELTHDILATIVKQDRDVRRRNQVYLRTLIKAFLLGVLIVVGLAIYGYNIKNNAEQKRDEIIQKNNDLKAIQKALIKYNDSLKGIKGLHTDTIIVPNSNESLCLDSLMHARYSLDSCKKHIDSLMLNIADLKLLMNSPNTCTKALLKCNEDLKKVQDQLYDCKNTLRRKDSIDNIKRDALERYKSHVDFIVNRYKAMGDVDKMGSWNTQMLMQSIKACNQNKDSLYQLIFIK